MMNQAARQEERETCCCMKITLVSFKWVTRMPTTWVTRARGRTACGLVTARSCLTPYTSKHSRSRTDSKPCASTQLTRRSFLFIISEETRVKDRK
jgi:hypothetical protein